MFKFSRLKGPYVILFLTAFLVRFGAVNFMAGPPNDDPDGYIALAENLRTYGVFGEEKTPTAYRPPLYPALLRAVYAFTPSSPDKADSPPFYLLSRQSATGLLNWILGVATVLIVYRLALILAFPRKWAFAAALLVAVDPILLAQSRTAMTETLAAFLAVLIVWTLTLAMMPRQKNWFAFAGIGLLAGLSVLCRPVFSVFGLLIFLGLLNYTRMRKLMIRYPFAFLLGFAVFPLLWGCRNQVKMGDFIIATTHGGYTLYLANNDSLYRYNSDPGPFAGPWDPAEFKKGWESVQAEDIEEYGVASGPQWELRRNELAYREAHAAMSRNTQKAVIASLVRIGNLWQFLPYQTDPDESQLHKACRWAVGIFYAVELPLALLGLLYICAPLVSLARRRLLISPYWSNWSWPVYLLISVQLLHIIYWTNMRMRAPLMTVVPIFAVIGLRLFFVRNDDEPVAVGGPPTPFDDSGTDEPGAARSEAGRPFRTETASRRPG